MKYFLLLFSLLCFFGSCKRENKLAVIKFASTNKSIVIKKGQTATSAFVFENIGSDSLRIYDVQAECDCIIVEFPKVPVPPKEKGKIKVAYKSDFNEKSERVIRSIVVRANTKPMLTPLSIISQFK